MDYRKHPYRPLLLDVTTAHTEGSVTYDEGGVATVVHPELVYYTGKDTLQIAPQQQYPKTVFATMADLNKPISAHANSPAVGANLTLRQAYDQEYRRFEAQVEEAVIQQQHVPNYGTYVIDHHAGNLYVVAPADWHRLGLVTSNAKLFADPGKVKTWLEIRAMLEQAKIGIAGASVGGSIYEGILRLFRPALAKLADYDNIELGNWNRLPRSSLRHYVTSRATQLDLMDQYELGRVNKAVSLVYEQQMVDPYHDTYTYWDGLTDANSAQFMLGNGAEEPRIDLLVEEVDNMRVKADLHARSKEYGIPLLMLSDFGQKVQVQFWDFRKKPQQNIGYKIDDATLNARLATSLYGSRDDMWNFVSGLCGDEFRDANDPFGQWVRGVGEQMGASVPQDGTTALIAGGIGAKVAAMYFLGYEIPSRIIYDFLHHEIHLE